MSSSQLQYSPAHRPKLDEPMYPLLPPFCQTPGPIVVPQSYLQRLILEHWEVEVKGCEHAKNAQLLEIVLGPALTIRQANLCRLIIEHWEVEVRHCEEAKWAQLLELVLAAHGISRLV
jgi:hypothetical protein